MSKVLRLTVVDSKGEPVEGAFVTIDESSQAVPEIALLSGDRGRLVLRLPEGRYLFTARASDGSLGRLDLTLTEDEQSGCVRLGANSEPSAGGGETSDAQ